MAQIPNILSQLSTHFSFQEALNLLKPISLFLIGIVIYSWFIFKFYRFVARRDIFSFKPELKNSTLGKFTHAAFYLIKYIIILPILIFFWFAILSIILIFLAKNSDIQNILLVSITLIGAIRIMAYYNEDLSKDLAKMLPFALLGVFLIDVSFFSPTESLSSFQQFPELWRVIIYYLLFIILLEFILRILYGIFQFFKKKKD